jgi:hypothetical protein
MPRPTSVPALTGSQTLYILEKLVDQKKVFGADIREQLAGMWQEMNFLEKRLSELRSMVGSVHPIRSVKKAAKRVVARAKRVTKTPEAAASRKLQGQYILGLLNAPIARRQMRARQFTRDVIDTLGHRLRELRIPSPDDRRAVGVGRRLQSVIDRKETFKRQIRETIRAIEPDIPRTAKGRPGWSMR